MLKIAFCDDETQETRRLEALLEEYAADHGQDFAHTSYQSPVELMAEVEKGTRFDIILLDVLMPGENGMAAAALCWARRCAIWPSSTPGGRTC